MKTYKFNSKVLDSWWALLKNLSNELKLELASRLIDSVRRETPTELTNNQTIASEESAVWVKTELYLVGLLTAIEGDSTIHFETEKLGSIIINAVGKISENDRKNRINKNQKLRIEMNQNPFDWSYDEKSAKLIEFIDHERVVKEDLDGYLNNLIQKSTKDWEDVEDSEIWLKEVRGYE